MKLQNLLPLLFLSIVACKPDSEKELASLKEEKSKIEAQLAEITSKIKALEKSSGKKTVVQRTAFVEVATLSPQSFKHYIEIQGKATTDNNLTISPRMGGHIANIYVKKGSMVKKGKLLASMDVAALLKGKEELKTALDFANNVYEKQKMLWEQKVGTEIQFLQAKNNKESLEKKIATLNEQIAFGQVTAPVAGMVEEVYSREGENAAPGMPMFRLVGKGEFRISADVSEAYAAHIKQGNEAEVFFPDISKNIQTSVKVVGDEINPLNRTFNIELALPKSSSFIKANMIAYVKIKDYEAKDRLQVPVSVVQKSVDGNFVFIEVNGKATKRAVKTGRDFNGQIEILDGLKTGDKLIVTGYLDLIEGQPLAQSKL